MELLVGVIAGLLVLLLLWWKPLSGRKTPPGPWVLPVVGYLPFLTSKPFLKFNELAKRYGNVFSLPLGSQYNVVLNDFKSTKEAFSQDALMGRPHEFPFTMSKENKDSGAFYGLPWKDQRRQCLHLLRDLGFGKSKMEEYIQEEIKEFLKSVDKYVDTSFCMRQQLMASVSNNIAAVVYGKRFEYNDPVLTKLVNDVTLTAKAADQTGWLIFYPFLKKLYDLFGKEPENQFERDYSQKQIDEHEKTLDPNNIRDFIDGYLLEIKKRPNDPAFVKPVLLDMVSAFFSAGTETTRTAVEWLTLISAKDQKAQRCIQAEIDEVIGHDRLPTFADHSKMPYTDAFIMEMMRWKTLVPVNLIRCALADTELNGYFIAKNTKILSNTWAIHHDPEYWGPDAEHFRPERFLTDDGKEIRKMERYMPFSIGKRSCPGEALGKMEMFLYFAAILQRYNLRMPNGKAPNFEGDMGVTLQPKAQDLIFSRRTDFV